MHAGQRTCSFPEVISNALGDYSPDIVDTSDMSFGINPENPYPNPTQDYLNKVNAGKPKFGDNLSSLIQRLGWG